MAKNTAIRTLDTLELVVYSIHIGALELGSQLRLC